MGGVAVLARPWLNLIPCPREERSDDAADAHGSRFVSAFVDAPGVGRLVLSSVCLYPGLDFGHNENRQALAEALSETLPGGIDRLAGVELGAVPLVVATALHTGLPYVIVRKAAKEYGGSAGRAVEGVIEEGEKVVLLEDVVSTGTQAVRAARELVGLGVEVVKVVAVLDRRDEPGGELEEFPFVSLLKMHELGVGKRD